MFTAFRLELDVPPGGTSTTITFQSLTGDVCGPNLDNVVLTKAP